jgi:hypothetical protein
MEAGAWQQSGGWGSAEIHRTAEFALTIRRRPHASVLAPSKPLERGPDRLGWRPELLARQDWRTLPMLSGTSRSTYLVKPVNDGGVAAAPELLAGVTSARHHDPHETWTPSSSAWTRVVGLAQHPVAHRPERPILLEAINTQR